MILSPKSTVETRVLTLADAIDQHPTPASFRWSIVSNAAKARKLAVHNDTLRWINDGIVWHNGARYYQDRFTWGPDAVGIRVMIQAHGLALDETDQRLPLASMRPK